MILEVAILDIKSGQQRQFENDFSLAGQYIASVTGYIRHSLRKCVEKDNRYILLVDWEELDDHTVGSRQSEGYQEWKNFCIITTIRFLS